MRKFPVLANRSTFYFFPAFLPLVELVPWVMGLLGMVAGIAGLSMPEPLRKHKRKLFWLMIVFLLAGGYFLVKSMPDKNLVRDGSRLTVKPSSPQTQSQPENIVAYKYKVFGEIWSVRSDKALLSTPAVSGDKLIYGSLDNSVEAFSLENGNHVWSLAQKFPVLTISKGRDSIIFAGEGFHDNRVSGLTAIDISDGRIIWRREFLGHIEEQLTYDPDKNYIYTGSGPGGIWTLNADNGDIIWHGKLGHIDSIPLLHENKLYVPAQVNEKEKRSIFYALGSASGDILWQLEQPGQPWGAPLMDADNNILTTTGIGQIGVARKTDKGWAQKISTDGKIAWQSDLPSMPIQPGIYLKSSNLFILTLKNGMIIAIDATNGSISWQSKPAGEFQSAAALIESTNSSMIAAAGYDGVFVMLDAATGVELYRQRIAKGSTSSPVVAGDMIFVTTPHEIKSFGGLHKLTENL